MRRPPSAPTTYVDLCLLATIDGTHLLIVCGPGEVGLEKFILMNLSAAL